MNENFSKEKLFQGMIFTLLITFATGLGNVLSEFFMLDVKNKRLKTIYMRMPDDKRLNYTVQNSRKVHLWQLRLCFGRTAGIPM